MAYTASSPSYGDAPTGAPRRVSWGGIIAGSVIAAALMVLLTTFGIGIGASTIDPTGQSPSGSSLGIGAGIYAVITQIVALGAGGYVAARLAGIPRPVTSLIHGAAVWAVTTLFLATVAILGGNALFGAASSLVGNTARGVSNAVEAIAPDNLSLPDPAQIASQVSFDSLPDEVQQALEEQDITPQNFQDEMQQSFRQVVSEEEQQQVVANARQSLTDILRSPGNAGEELQSFIDETLSGPGAVLGDEDRQEALTVLERRTGITPEEAEQVVAQVETRIDEAVAEVRQTIEDAQQQALDAAEAASNAAATTALLLSLVSVLGLAAACGGAFAGKPDRFARDYA
ncbi:hypothetical protein LX81_03814 [Palleronia aestuarii]|uniref:Uncharacterized protein n=1 Tax=Palleronia aestuarii TaxID=568105 RepID=A0A2W7MUM8_9RHOB|nr:hypothetical protein [Palleronia aestuarii]PZX11845.1 hypothetical protein LX81_03814 [Palleronia aestuarii]